MEGGPMTRSRRNLITESAEKENINSAPSTPAKNTDSTDTSPPRMASKDVISSPARITRNRKSLSFCSNPLDSPSKNLRKKNGSPQSVKSSPMKLNTPKKSEDAKNSSITEMTPTKRLLKRNEGILSTVDSPKPRRPRYSLSDASDSNLDTSVRRSRRLSTDLSVVKEDPISEAIVELPVTVPKTRRGKRMSVAPSQPVLPEENESSDANSEKIEIQFVQSPVDNRKSPKTRSSQSPTDSNKSLEIKSNISGFSTKDFSVVLENCNQKSLEKRQTLNKSASSNVSLKESNAAELQNSPKTTENNTNEISNVPENKDDINIDKLNKSNENSFEMSPNDTFLNFKLDDSSDELNSSKKSTQKKRLSAKDVFMQEKSPSKEEETKEKSFGSNTPKVKSNRSSLENNVGNSLTVNIFDISKSNSLIIDSKDSTSPKIDNSISNDNENLIDFNDIAVTIEIESDTSLIENNITDGNSMNISKSKLNTSKNINISNFDDKMDVDEDVDMADIDSIHDKSKSRLSKSGSNKSLNVSSSSNKSNHAFNDTIPDANVSKGSKSKTRLSNFESNESIREEEIVDFDADSTIISTSKKRLSSTGENKSLNISNKSSKSNESFKNEDIDIDTADTTMKPKKRKSSIENNKSLNISNSSTKNSKIDKSFKNEDFVDIEDDTETPKSKKRQSSIGNKTLNVSNSSIKSKSNKSSNENNADISDDSNSDENKSLNVSKSSKKSSKKRSSITASTPMNVNKSGNKSNDDKDTSRSFSKNRSDLGKSVSDSESDDDSSDRNSLLEMSALEVGSDYRSGDSMDESERREIEENEIHETGETLISDSEDEETDDTYEKDSFICSSENEDETLLSGTGDDLSSGEELTQSAKSKAKYNKKHEEEQKRASREMFLARHSGEKSLSKSKNKLRIESDDSALSVNDEAEITNVTIKSPATKDPLSISTEIPQKEKEEDEDSNMSSDDEDEEIRNTFNEELKKLQSIDVNSDSSSEEEPAELNSKKMTIQDKENDLISKKKKSRSELNKSDTNLKLNDKKSKKLNKSSSVLECEKSHCGNIALSSLTVQESMERLRKMDESVSKIFTSLMNKMDKVTCSIDANIQNSANNQLEPAHDESKTDETTTISKRKIEFTDNTVETPQKKICISNDIESEKKEPLSSAIVKIDNKSKQAPNSLKISNKSKTIKRRKTSISDMKADKISDAANKLRNIPADLIEQKNRNKFTATSEFKVESKNVKPNKNTWTESAGEFAVSVKVTNSTTNFKVIPLRKNPKSAIQVDTALASNFIDFKTNMLYGKNIKRVASSDLRNRREKKKAGK